MFDLSKYVEEEDYCDFIAYNFSDIEEFISYLNKKGFTTPKISLLFNNYEELIGQYSMFAKSQE